MKNEKFIKFRKAHFTQSSLSEKMHVPILTIRKWEYGLSIPSIDDIKNLANIFKVNENIILSFFKPSKTKVTEEKENNSKSYNEFLELFWSCNTGTHFILFTYLFASAQTLGVICCHNYIFPFTKIVSDDNGIVTVFVDKSENYIVLTDMNIIEVKPTSVNYDVYTFDIIINCPLFPTDLKYSPDSFQQKIRVSIFNR